MMMQQCLVNFKRHFVPYVSQMIEDTVVKLMLYLKYSIHVIRKIEKKEGIFTAVNTSLASLEV